MEWTFLSQALQYVMNAPQSWHRITSSTTALQTLPLQRQSEGHLLNRKTVNSRQGCCIELKLLQKLTRSACTKRHLLHRSCSATGPVYRMHVHSFQHSPLPMLCETLSLSRDRLHLRVRCISGYQIPTTLCNVGLMVCGPRVQTSSWPTTTNLTPSFSNSLTRLIM